MALDAGEDALAAIRDNVDLTLKSNEEGVADRILEFTSSYGVDVVLDFVGNDATLRLRPIWRDSGARPGLRRPSVLDSTVAIDAALGRFAYPPYSGTYNGSLAFGVVDVRRILQWTRC